MMRLFSHGLRRVIPALILFIWSAADLAPCTSFILQTGKVPFFGTNYDNRIWQGLLFVNQKNVQKTGLVKGTTGRTAAWAAKFGSVTFSLIGPQLAWGGMNEEGLVLSTMYLENTKNPLPDERPPLTSSLWMQYLLDTCRSVDEVIASEKHVRIAGSVDHYLVCDAGGGCATVEFLDGRMVVHTGASLPVRVLANTPYASCVESLAGGKAEGLDRYHSIARFARVAEALKTAGVKSSEEAVEESFAILKSVASAGTQWSIVFDISGRAIHFTSSRNARQRTIYLSKLDFRCGRPVKTLDVHADLSGDISRLFKEYDHELSVRFALRTVRDFGGNESESLVRQLFSIFEKFPCLSEKDKEKQRP